jgi:site-specific recombinase XerD
MSNEDAIQRFVAYLRTECGCSNHTIESYRFDIQKFSAWLSRPFVSVARTDVSDYLSYLIRSGHSGCTAARHLAALRSFYAFLVDEGSLERNPTRNLPRPKAWKKVPKTIRQDDFEKMVAVCDSSFLGIRDRAGATAGSPFDCPDLYTGFHGPDAGRVPEGASARGVTCGLESWPSGGVR